MVALILLVSLIIYGLFKFDVFKNNESNRPNLDTVKTDSNQPQTAKIIKALADTSVFPADFPYEKDANVLDNYEVVAKGVTAQNTITYESKQTMEENYKQFSDYFKTNGWEIEDTKKQQNYEYIIARKEKQLIQTSITKQDNGYINVEVTISDIL